MRSSLSRRVLSRLSRELLNAKRAFLVNKGLEALVMNVTSGMGRKTCKKCPGQASLTSHTITTCWILKTSFAMTMLAVNTRRRLDSPPSLSQSINDDEASADFNAASNSGVAKAAARPSNNKNIHLSMVSQLLLLTADYSSISKYRSVPVTPKS